jgi:tRNA(Arg) A34 adenosine deaminase TadA
MSPSEVASRNDKREEFFMQKALQVAQHALNAGEVPVGCVIVWNENGANRSPNDDDKGSLQEEVSTTQFDYVTSQDVIISHGANQVNATRDATRHAECVAIDRLLSGGMMSDKNRLPQKVIENAYPQSGESFPDIWINIPDSPTHWKNNYGWGSNKLFKRSQLRECDLYVTVEPCISKST